MAVMGQKKEKEKKKIIMIIETKYKYLRIKEGEEIKQEIKQDKTINHITSESSALTQNQYKKKHDTVDRAVH